jgi:hypothetical protein
MLPAIIKHMILVKHKNLKNVCGLLYYVYRSVDPYIEQTPTYNNKASYCTSTGRYWVNTSKVLGFLQITCSVLDLLFEFIYEYGSSDPYCDLSDSDSAYNQRTSTNEIVSTGQNLLSRPNHIYW